MEPLTVSVDVARKALGIGTTKIYELLNDGSLQSVYIGRRRFIKTDSMRAFVERAA